MKYPDRLDFGLVVCASFVILLTGCGGEETPTPVNAESPPPTSAAVPTGLSDEEATAAIRQFYIAMVNNDAQTLQGLIMTNPGSAVLWSGEKLADNQRDMVVKQFDTIIARRAKAGDTVKVPNGQLRITEEISNDTRPFFVVTVAGRDMATPLWMHRVDGQWRIDAGPIIAARIAANKARTQHKQNSDTPKPLE